MTGVVASTSSLPAGGGPYELPALTVGVFLNSQPDHRLSLGSARRREIPLGRHQGWLLPAGAEGLCEYGASLDVTMVSIPSVLVREVQGTCDPASARPVIGELDPLLVQMVLQAGAYGRGGALYAQTMHHALAAHVVQLVHPAESDAPAIDDLRLRRAIEYAKAHLADDLSLDAMASVAAMSPSHFARAFKRATGTSPLQFVIAERLAMSMALLRTTQLSIAEIACRVGYNDVSRFGQHFRRRFGVTPGAVRAD